MPRRVVLVLNRRKSLAESLEPGVRGAIETHGELVDVIEVDDVGDELPPADVVVVIGGDGTLLTTARACLGSGVPLIGVNAGRVGFMAAYDAATFIEDAARLLGDAGELEVVDLPTLRATVRSGSDDQPAWEREAINEFVITAGPPYRMISLGLRFDGVEGPEVHGDGLITSTPMGSTAYNVSAGGPIAAPGSAGMIVTPIAAHSLAFRPIVLGSGTVFEVDVVRGNDGGTGLVGDGQVSVELKTGDRVTISASGRPARFVANPRVSYWRTLVEKMGWGAPPGRR